MLRSKIAVVDMYHIIYDTLGFNFSKQYFFRVIKSSISKKFGTTILNEN